MPKQEVIRLKKTGFLLERNRSLFSCIITTRSGRLDVEEWNVISELAATYGDGEINLLSEGRVAVKGIKYEQIDTVRAFCDEKELSIGIGGNKIEPIGVCQEFICEDAIFDAYELAEKFRMLFYERLKDEDYPKNIRIGVSGCSKGCQSCGQYDIAVEGIARPELDLELCKGCLNCAVEKVCADEAVKMVDGCIHMDKSKCSKCGKCIEKCPFGVTTFSTKAYRLYLGAIKDGELRSSRYFTHLFTTEESLLSVIDRLLYLYQQEGKEGESFDEMIDRIGIKMIEKKVLA